MTERRYTLEEITGAMGDALTTLCKHGDNIDARALRVFVDHVVARLKDPTPADAMLDALLREPFSSPND